MSRLVSHVVVGNRFSIPLHSSSITNLIIIRLENHVKQEGGFQMPSPYLLLSFSEIIRNLHLRCSWSDHDHACQTLVVQYNFDDERLIGYFHR